MARRARPNLTLLALITASGLLSAGEGLKPLTPFHLAALRGQESHRCLRIMDQMAAQKSAFGLGLDDGLKETAHFTDAYGETHVHLQQTYRGVKVWNSHLIGHLDASGNLRPAQATVHAGIGLAPASLIGEDRIQAIVARNLPGEGRLWPLQIEQVVLPTKFQDGIKLVRDAEGRMGIDAKYSVGTPRRKDPYVWAFHVSAMQATKHGLEGTEFILDGRTGEILKKWDGNMHQAAPTAAVGTGQSQYNGSVSLNTLQLTDGTYTLRDTTRATKPWPKLSAHSSWTECSGVGIQTLYWDDYATTVSGLMPFSSTTNAWGDGQIFGGTLRNANSETAAVDAHYAIQATWDYYAKVHGRTGGIDGQGGSPISLVHYTDYGSPWANAAWNPSLFLMMYGDGGETGALASLDVAAHEMSHGVMSYTANLSGGEALGLNEANSDVHGAMVKFWMWGAGGTGSVVPEATTASPDGNNDPLHTWTMGVQLSTKGEPLRWLYKPSKDGLSYDAWFDGVGADDSHFSSGPGNRAFYFLSQGASNDATKDTYSGYLPAGMSGIGNDKAAKIWFHAMATKVTDPGSDYHAIRDAVIASARELYPDAGSVPSAETAAVMNAFAAINVGAPVGGPEPVRVSFPEMPGAGDIFTSGKIIVAPSLEPVALPVPTVANAADRSVTWGLGGLSAAVPSGGKLLANGSFVAPVMSYGSTWPIKATSKADPRQYAVNLVFGASMDCDADTETDACDMAGLALAYGGVNVYPASNIYNSFYGTDDICVALFLMGFNNAFTH